MLNEQIDFLKAELMQTNQKFENYKNEQLELLQSKDEDFEDKLNTLRNNYKKQIDDLIKEHLKETSEQNE